MTPAFPHVITSSQQAWKLIEKDYTLRLSLVANEWATEHLRAWNAVFAEGRRRGNSAYYGPALVDMEIADMDKRAQWACDIFCEIWQIQGRNKCRPFFQTVFEQGINPVLSTREGCFQHGLELHLKRTGRELSQGLPAIMHSMKQRTGQLRAKWNTKLEIAARDAENQECLARERETQIASAPTPSIGSDAGDPWRTNDPAWQQFANDFARLAEEEKGKARLNVMAAQELNHSGDMAVWAINDSYSENFKARFELLASQAGKSLGPLPSGASPFTYWLHRLYQHLREERSSLSRSLIYTAKTDAGNQVSLECPLVEGACEASSTFCLRLQKRTFENGHEGKEISVCFQDWIENNRVSVSIPAEISERNSVSLVAKSAQIPIPIEFLSCRLQEIRLLRGSTAFGSPRNFLDVKAETHGLMWAITGRGLWMAQQPPSAGAYIDARGMQYGNVPIKEVEILSPHRQEAADSRFARMAVDEARKSAAEDERAHPMVGCVVVKDGQVLAAAHRGEMEGRHAEFIALEKKLGDEILTGCTVYTTLEPCTTRNHPKIPCANRLIERRVARVVIGMHDPNPKICGRGIRKLQGANIEVKLFPHALIKELEELNRHFTRSFGETGTAGRRAKKERLVTENPKVSKKSSARARSKPAQEVIQDVSLEPQTETRCDFSPRALLISKELSIKAFPVIQESSWSEEIELTVAAETSEIDSIFSRFRGHEEALVVAYGFDVAVAKLKAVSRIASAGGAIWRLQLDPIRTDFSNDMEMGTSGTSADEFAEKRVRRLLLNENPMAIKSDKNDMLRRANELTFESLIQGLNSIVKIEHSTFIDIYADFADDRIKFTEIAWISAVADLKLSAAVKHIDHLTLELNRNVLNVDFLGRRHRKYINVPPYEIAVRGSITFPPAD